MISFKSLRHALLMGVASFGGVSAAAAIAQPAYAQEVTRTYNIEAQDLNSALREFALLTGRDVLYPPEIVAGKRSAGVHGQLTEHDALQALLAGSGLRFEQTASNGYAVQDPNSPTRLGDASGAAPSDDGATSEILVTGRHTLNTDIRRTEDDTQPYVVFSGDDVRQSGAQSIEEFFRTRLPMNAISADGANSSLSGGGQLGTGEGGTFNLRGLGTDQTLVLVDGRRLAATASGVGFSQPSINGIPTAAIERIEVLPSTASGVFGGGATGGAINIILKRNFSGFDIDATYGETFDSDTPLTNLSASGGFSLNGGRTRVLLSGAHIDQNGLTSLERDFGRGAFDLYAAHFPVTDPIVRSMAVGPTPNIFSQTGASLVLDPAYGGASLGSPITYVPDGYSGPASDDALGLLNNAGAVRGRGTPNLLLAGSTRDALTFDVRHDLTSNIEAYLGLYWDHTTNSYDVPKSANALLLANDPNNPFQQNIIVTIPAYQNGLSADTHGEQETRRYNLGLIAHLPWNWSAAADYSFSQYSTSSTSNIVNTVTGAGVATLRAAALRDISAFPVSDIQSLFGGTTTVARDQEGDLHDLSLRASGPLVDLPGGALTLSAALEWRQQSHPGLFTTNTFYGDFSFVDNVWNPGAEQDVRSAYVELRAPILSASNNIPLVHDLEFTAAVRNDVYDTHYAASYVSVSSPDGPFPPVSYLDPHLESTDYTLGLRYSPIEDVTFRASYGTGFLPPQLLSLTSLPAQDLLASDSLWATTTDPLRNDEPLSGDPGTALITLITGGNPHLQPEESASFSYGAIFTPHFLEGLRVSVDFTRIQKDGEITAPPSYQFLLDNEDNYPGRIVRAPLTSDDLTASPPYTAGRIISIDATSLNLFHTDVEALDIQVDYIRPTTNWGTWAFHLIATHQIEFERQVNIDLAPANSAGRQDGPLSWSGNLGIDWNAGSWSLGWNAQYLDGYNLCRSTETDADCLAGRTARAQGTTAIRSQIYHDLAVRYDFGTSSNSLLSGADVTLSIQNLFDEEPPIVAALGSITPFGDPRLRRFALTIRKHFGG